jgi:membrane-associated phospholipid phosphatase
MAVMLTVSMRSNRYALTVALSVNGLMLISTVPVGHHYLVDVVAGCAVAVVSLYVARWTDDRTKLFAQLVRRPRGAEPLAVGSGANA